MSETARERDRLNDQRAAELDLHEAALAAREEALAEREASMASREQAQAKRTQSAQEILAAADERDAISDSRDIGGDTREEHVDRAHFLATGETYGEHLPLRRGAALDRQHAKGDREASHEDRIALTEDPDDSDA
jgi:uncharacterized protein (DUF3084 family)